MWEVAESSASSPAVWRSIALVLGFGVALGLVAQLLRRLARATSRAGSLAEADSQTSAPIPSAESGSVITEFALVFPIGMMVLLLFIQAAFILQATLVVEYSAFCAARAAQVWVSRPLSNTDPERAEYLALLGRSDSIDHISSEQSDSPKTARIQLAAAYACWPISARLDDTTANVAGGSRPWAVSAVAQILPLYKLMPGAPNVTSRWSDADWTAKYLYAVLNTQVRIRHIQPWGEEPLPWGTYRPDSFIRVDVRHQYALRVPFASKVLGQPLTTMGSEQIPSSVEDPLYAFPIEASVMLSNEGRREFPGGVPYR